MSNRTREFSDVSIVDETLEDSLESLDDATNYRDWIMSLAAPYLGENILEIGAGHGTFTAELATSGRVHAVELSPRAGAVLAERFRSTPGVTTQTGTASEVVEAGFDTSVMINVLEHVDDESGVLTEIRNRLGAGGHLVLWVPAFPLLYSRFDHRLGHHRRYRRRELEQIVEDHGFDVITSRYVNLAGWFSWLLLVRLLRNEPTNPTMIKVFDRFVVPPLRALESRWPAPFGQSVFVAARVAD